jgi:hypothetical protein
MRGTSFRGNQQLFVSAGGGCLRTIANIEGKRKRRAIMQLEARYFTALKHSLAKDAHRFIPRVMSEKVGRPALNSSL